MTTRLIEVTQKPIINFDLIEAKGKEVDDKIKSLNIENLDDTEENLASIKKIRADLNNHFQEYENQRKMAKDIVTEPYDAMSPVYTKFISKPFRDADVILKTKVDAISKGILDKKIAGINEYFKAENRFDFVTLESFRLKIIKSRSDKQIKTEIDEKLAQISNDIDSIERLDNSNRVLAKYHQTLDLSRSISEVNIEIEREQKLESEQEQKEKQVKEQAVEKPTTKAGEILQEFEKEHPDEKPKRATRLRHSESIVITEPDEPPLKADLRRFSFNIIATVEQKDELKKVMDIMGVSYE